MNNKTAHQIKKAQTAVDLGICIICGQKRSEKIMCPDCQALLDYELQKRETLKNKEKKFLEVENSRLSEFYSQVETFLKKHNMELKDLGIMAGFKPYTLKYWNTKGFRPTAYQWLKLRKVMDDYESI